MFSYPRLINILKYLAMELDAESLLDDYMEDLCQLYREISVTFSYCADLICCTNFHIPFIKALSDAVQEDTGRRYWFTTTGERVDEEYKCWSLLKTRFLKPAAALLPHVQCSVLDIYFREDVETPHDDLKDLLEKVVDHFRGKLRIYLKRSRIHFQPADDVLSVLDGAK